jgi:hypothetical protein
MPIVFKCKCGRSFTAKPERAGKRFPCPGCGTTLQVPQPAAASATPATAAPPAEGAPSR